MKRIIGSVDFCQRCGAEYTVRAGMRKFCHSCAIELGLDRSDTRDDPLMFAARNCVVCGKKFEVLGRRNLCCSPECFKVHQRIKAAECGTVRRRKAGVLPRPNCTGYRWVVPYEKNMPPHLLCEDSVISSTDFLLQKKPTRGRQPRGRVSSKISIREIKS